VAPIVAHFRYLLAGAVVWLAVAAGPFAAARVLAAEVGAASEKAEIMAFARLAIERAVRQSGQGAGVEWKAETKRLGAASPVFLTLVLDGRTRACQGSLEPTSARLALEIEAAASRIAAGDRRHPPLSLAELERGRLVISIPGPRRALPASAVDPRRFGLVVEADAGGSGVLLPGEARTFDWMLREARRRAGAVAATGWRAWIFPTEVFGETKLPGVEPQAEERRRR